MKVSSLASDIHQIVSEEIELHHAYIKALERERAIVVSANTTALTSATSVREKLLQGIAKAQAKRFTLMRQALGEPEKLGRQQAPPPSITLSMFVERFCTSSERQLLLPKIEILRSLVAQSQVKSREFGEVVGFSLRMIGGLASIIWSATKSVLRSYTPKGGIKESTHEGSNRKSGVLKQA